MGSSRPQANVFEIVDFSEETNNIGIFSNEEVQSLRHLLSQLKSQSTTAVSSNFIKSGNAFLANLEKSFWIIDSGAKKHMTGSPNKFLTYSSCSGKKKSA